MRIREAYHSDIPEILRVLKASLGETSSKKTESIWRYKHIDNPFGESLVLVAEEEEEIIGVRAFMRWRWQRGEQVYSAFRAVDTATHPEHQGKGVFKKLTLKALEIGKERGDHFVFNTPNAQSKPGYLKMGWKEVNKLYVQIVPMSPLFWGDNPIKQYQKNILTDSKYLLRDWNKELMKEDRLYTPKTWEYLRWRYLNNPLQDYRVEATENYFIVAYVKYQNSFRELRISELILIDTKYQKLCKDIIRKWAREYGVHFISLNFQKNKKLFKVKIAGNFGPVLTFRELENASIDKDFGNIENWTYSIGDLELF